MPQTSIAYAAARIHLRTKTLLDRPRLERMLTAQGITDARRVLIESGLLSADGAKDAEAAADARLLEACSTIRKITPCAYATDCFLLRYDGMNLKMLIKARTLHQKAESLSRCGVLDPEILRHAVSERSYGSLPSTLQAALKELEEVLALRDDPLLIDQTIDKAIYQLIQGKLPLVKSRVVRDYFTAKADMINAIMLLRAKKMGRSASFVKEMLLPGGCIPDVQFVEAFQKPEALKPKLLAYGAKVAEAFLLAASDASKLPQLEKAMEDALLAPFQAHKGSIYRIEPIIGYLLGAEREAKAIRLIFAGHASGIAPEKIRERMVDSYGG